MAGRFQLWAGVLLVCAAGFVGSVRAAAPAAAAADPKEHSESRTIGRTDVKITLWHADAKVANSALAATLEETGGALGDIVTMTVFITDVANNTRLVELRKEFFADDYPASTLVTVAALNRPEMMVEIQAVAVVG